MPTVYWIIQRAICPPFMAMARRTDGGDIRARMILCRRVKTSRFFHELLDVISMLPGDISSLLFGFRDNGPNDRKLS